MTFLAGLRTPLGHPCHAFDDAELGSLLAGELIQRSGLDPFDIEGLACGPPPSPHSVESLARQVALGCDLDPDTDCHDLYQGDATGLRSLITLATAIRAGQMRCGLAGAVQGNQRMSWPAPWGQPDMGPLARRHRINEARMKAQATASYEHAQTAIEAGWLDAQCALLPLGEECLQRDHLTRRPHPIATRVPGAAMVLLCHPDTARHSAHSPLGLLHNHACCGVPPHHDPHLAPCYALAAALSALQLDLSDLDRLEMDEPSAATLLANLDSLASEEFCRAALGTTTALGRPRQLNPDGGALALGHCGPASGLILLLLLLYGLQRQGGGLGAVTVAGDGGTALALIVEALP